ncbi:MAG: methylmalonyl-CoA mutase family protein, partial [Limnochordales bacterium]
MWEPTALEGIRRALDRWRSGPAGQLPPRETSARIPLEPLYTPAHLAGLDFERAVGWPGQYPFTRGPYPTMYRGRLWTMRQYAGYGTAADANRRFHYLLSQGTTGLSVAFDLPTQLGYDSDHPLARGEVGRVGVAIDTLADMEALLDGIPLDQVSTSMTINATAPWLLALYVACAERQGVARKVLQGTTQNDIFKEYLSRGTYIFPPQPSLRLIGDVIAFTLAEIPKWNPINVCSYHLQEAGATAEQELAYALATAITVLDFVRDGGQVKPDAFPRVVGRISFFVNAGVRFIGELC